MCGLSVVKMNLLFQEITPSLGATALSEPWPPVLFASTGLSWTSSSHLTFGLPLFLLVSRSNRILYFQWRNTHCLTDSMDQLFKKFPRFYKAQTFIALVPVGTRVKKQGPQVASGDLNLWLATNFPFAFPLAFCLAASSFGYILDRINVNRVVGIRWNRRNGNHMGYKKWELYLKNLGST